MRHVRRRPLVLVLVLAGGLTTAAAGWSASPPVTGHSSLVTGRSSPAVGGRLRQSLAPYVPTPQEIVERMLDVAQVAKNDVVYDLGCGDGRIVITAAKKYGARGVGVDIDPERIREAQANAKKAGVERLVEFLLQDAMKTDVSRATVVTLYLLSSSNLKLRPTLTRQLKPGARIVSHAFDMADWKPDRVEAFTDDSGFSRTVYLWKVDGKYRP